MANNKGGYANNRIIDGKRYCRPCGELHELHYMCPQYGLKMENIIKAYVKEQQLKADQLIGRRK